MNHPAIDLIEDGSYQKAAELMLSDIYEELCPQHQIDYWASEIKRKHECAKKAITDFASCRKPQLKKFTSPSRIA
jgi:hypothetical protein